MLYLQLVQRNPVERYKPADNVGHQLQLVLHARLRLKELQDTRNLVRCHIDEEDVRQVRRGSLLDLAQHLRLHQIDRENQHDSRAQRGEHCGRLIPRAVKIGQPLAQELRQAQTHQLKQPAQQA